MCLFGGSEGEKTKTEDRTCTVPLLAEVAVVPRGREESALAPPRPATSTSPELLVDITDNGPLRP